jgi:hypothetical protein
MAVNLRRYTPCQEIVGSRPRKESLSQSNALQPSTLPYPDHDALVRDLSFRFLRKRTHPAKLYFAN